LNPGLHETIFEHPWAVFIEAMCTHGLCSLKPCALVGKAPLPSF